MRRARACSRSEPPVAPQRPLAAGITWTSRTLNATVSADQPTGSAGWAARAHHTSVVNASGAIYVIGGVYGSTVYNDVWVSTDGGARPDSGVGWSGVL